MDRLFDFDPLTGAWETFHYDESDGKVRIKRHVEVGPHLDTNKALANADDRGWSPSRNMRRVASIPVEVALLWKEKHGVDVWNRNHAEGVKRLLNSNEYAYLRTAPGRL